MTRTYGTVEDMDVLRKIMGVAHMRGRAVPPVGRDGTARDGAEQFAFTDGEGHLGACELERNRSEMVMPGMSSPRNAAGSEAIGNWALTRGIRLVKSGHGFDMERQNSKGKA